MGNGRCKLHGGCAGAPKNNQNASTHGLTADPHHYHQSLPPEEREFVERLSQIILDRVERLNGDLDHMDHVLARQVAIQFHIASKATAYVQEESGLMQEVPSGASSRKEGVPLLKEIRKYDQSIFQNLDKLGVFDQPPQNDVTITELWREFVGEEPDS